MESHDQLALLRAVWWWFGDENSSFMLQPTYLIFKSAAAPQLLVVVGSVLTFSGSSLSNSLGYALSFWKSTFHHCVTSLLYSKHQNSYRWRPMAVDLAPGGTNDNADEYTLETARGRDDGIFLIWPAVLPRPNHTSLYIQVILTNYRGTIIFDRKWVGVKKMSHCFSDKLE